MKLAEEFVVGSVFEDNLDVFPSLLDELIAEEFF